MAARVSASRRRRGLIETLYAYGYITPAIAAMVVASFVPLAFTIYVAFTDWNQYHPDLVVGFHYVGFRNFIDVIQSLQGEFLGVLIWTLAFAALSTAINFSLGMGLAFLLNNPHMRERNLYRTLLIVPWAIPGTIMTIAWTGLLNQDFGAVNNLLSYVNLGPIHLGATPWLTDPFWARVAVIMVNAWAGYPFMMTANLGALQSISTDLLEAAEVDGAGVWTRFRRIVLPLLRSATLPLTISTFAYNLNNFGAIYLLTQGNPVTAVGSQAGATDILPTYTYKLALQYSSYGVACAYSFLIFIIIGGLSFINMKYSRAFEAVD